MNPVWILAKLTLREAIRRRIMLAGLILGISFLILFTIGFHFILTQIRSVTAANAPSQGIAHVADVESMRHNPDDRYKTDSAFGCRPWKVVWIRRVARLISFTSGWRHCRERIFPNRLHT